MMVYNVLLAPMILLVGYVIYVRLLKPKLKTLEGRHVVITGGSSGIGKSVALEAAALGAHVTVISRNVGNLDKTVSEVLKHCKDRQKQKIQYLSLDVTGDYDNISKELATLEETVGPIYMLVNCAGQAVCGRLEDMSAEDVKYMIDLNYLGTAYPTKAVLGSMKTRGEGIIVIVSSGAGLIGVYGMGAYGASKWAVRGLGEALLMEVIGTGVSVTISYPPDTDTPGFKIEEQTKPMETRLISESGGLVSSQEVAKKLIVDALDGKTYSVVGFESWLLANLCIMSFGGVISSLWQASTIGIIRLVYTAYQFHFASIVMRGRQERDTNKKAE